MHAKESHQQIPVLTQQSVSRIFGYTLPEEIEHHLNNCPRHYIRGYYAEIYLGSADKISAIKSNNDKYLLNQIIRAIQASGILLRPGKDRRRRAVPAQTNSSQTTANLNRHDASSDVHQPLESDKGPKKSSARKVIQLQAIATLKSQAVVQPHSLSSSKASSSCLSGSPRQQNSSRSQSGSQHSESAAHSNHSNQDWMPNDAWPVLARQELLPLTKVRKQLGGVRPVAPSVHHIRQSQLPLPAFSPRTPPQALPMSMHKLEWQRMQQMRMREELALYNIHLLHKRRLSRLHVPGAAKSTGRVRESNIQEPILPSACGPPGASSSSVLTTEPVNAASTNRGELPNVRTLFPGEQQLDSVLGGPYSSDAWRLAAALQEQSRVTALFRRTMEAAMIGRQTTSQSRDDCLPAPGLAPGLDAWSGMARDAEMDIRMQHASNVQRLIKPTPLRPSADSCLPREGPYLEKRELQIPRRRSVDKAMTGDVEISDIDERQEDDQRPLAGKGPEERFPSRASSSAARLLRLGGMRMCKAASDSLDSPQYISHKAQRRRKCGAKARSVSPTISDEVVNRRARHQNSLRSLDSASMGLHASHTQMKVPASAAWPASRSRFLALLEVAEAMQSKQSQ